MTWSPLRSSCVEPRRHRKRSAGERNPLRDDHVQASAVVCCCGREECWSHPVGGPAMIDSVVGGELPLSGDLREQPRIEGAVARARGIAHGCDRGSSRCAPASAPARSACCSVTSCAPTPGTRRRRRATHQGGQAERPSRMRLTRIGDRRPDPAAPRDTPARSRTRRRR